jgi:hypothetical protein
MIRLPISGSAKAEKGRIRSDRSDTKKSSNYKDHPTYPTYPTQNNTIGTERGRQAPIMPKCAICGTSIPTDRVPGVSTDDGLAHGSCVEHGLPTRRQ